MRGPFSVLAIVTLSFLLRLVDFTVNIAGLDKLVMLANSYHLTVIQHHDLVRMLYRAYTLGDYDLGGFWNVLRKGLLYDGVGLGVNSAGGIVQNEDFGFLQQRAGNTQALLLTAGHIGAALLNMGFVLIREGLDTPSGPSTPMTAGM